MKSYFSILFISFCLFSIPALKAQVTLYPVKSDTAYYKFKANGQLKPSSLLRAEIRIVEFYKNNELIERKRSSLATGIVLQREFYKDGRPFGKWLYYNKAGEFVFTRDFTKLVYGECNPMDTVGAGMTLPEFGKGETDLRRYLRLNMKYPAQSRSLGTTGILQILFTIDETGKTEVNHICGNGLDGYCDLVVWEIVEQMPRWKPGKINGKPVEMRYILPVSFKLH